MTTLQVDSSIRSDIALVNQRRDSGVNASIRQFSAEVGVKRLSGEDAVVHKRRHSSLSSLQVWRNLFAPPATDQNKSPELASVQENLLSIERYRIFTPAVLHRQLSQEIRPEPESPISPSSSTFYASLLLADISGFTRLSSRLSAEELKHHINEYFSKLLDVIKTSGGDVVKFLGDAVLIVFPCQPDDNTDVKSATVLMASLCALLLIKECGIYDKGEGTNLVSLRLHCGIGCGEVHGMVLGEGRRWEYLVSGPPLHQIGKCIGQASTGEVCVSDEAQTLISDKLEIKQLPNGGHLLTGRRAPTSFQKKLNSKTRPNSAKPNSLLQLAVGTPSKPIQNSPLTISGPEIAVARRLTAPSLSPHASPTEEKTTAPSRRWSMIRRNVLGNAVEISTTGKMKPSTSTKEQIISKNSVQNNILHYSNNSNNNNSGSRSIRKPNDNGSNSIGNANNGVGRKSFTNTILRNMSFRGSVDKSTRSVASNISDLDNLSFRSTADTGTKRRLSNIASETTSTKQPGLPNVANKYVTEEKDAFEEASPPSLNSTASSTYLSNPNVSPIANKGDLGLTVNTDMTPTPKSQHLARNLDVTPSPRIGAGLIGNMFTNANKIYVSNNLPSEPSTPVAPKTSTTSPLVREGKQNPKSLTSQSSNTSERRNSRPSVYSTMTTERKSSFLQSTIMKSSSGVSAILSADSFDDNNNDGIEDNYNDDDDLGSTFSLFNLSKAVVYHFSEKNYDPFPLLHNNPHVAKAKRFLRGYLITENKPQALVPTMSPQDELIEKNLSKEEDLYKLDLVVHDPYIPEMLPLFVHDAARSALESVGLSYLFELRNITTLFLNVLGLEDDFNRGDITRPQTVIEVCLTALDRYGGSLRQYTVDDKGCVVIAAWGLPGSSHEDNNRRAVDAAVTMEQLLKDAGIGCGIGIAEGRVFCGLVGSAQRCEYAMMGSSVNLAARLMCKCTAGEVIVNESVYQSAKSAFAFTALPRIQAKGFEHPVAVYKPTKRIYKNVVFGANNVGDIGFVGRSMELLETVRALELAMSKHKERETITRAITIEGAPGVGKTCLAAEAISIVGKNRGIPVELVAAVAKPANQQAPYSVIAQILEQTLGLNRTTTMGSPHGNSPGSVLSPNATLDRMVAFRQAFERKGSTKLQVKDGTMASVSGQVRAPSIEQSIHANKSRSFHNAPVTPDTASNGLTPTLAMQFPSSLSMYAKGSANSHSVHNPPHEEGSPRPQLPHTTSSRTIGFLTSALSTRGKGDLYSNSLELPKSPIMKALSKLSNTGSQHGRDTSIKSLPPVLDEVNPSKEAAAASSQATSPIKDVNMSAQSPVPGLPQSPSSRALGVIGTIGREATSILGGNRAVSTKGQPLDIPHSIVGHSARRSSIKLDMAQASGSIGRRSSLTMTAITAAASSIPTRRSSMTSANMVPQRRSSINENDVKLSPIIHWLEAHTHLVSHDLKLLPAYVDGNSVDCTHPLKELLPLLGEVLQLPLVDNDTTRGFTLDQRSRFTEDVVLYFVLCALYSKETDLIVIDNLQWCDIQSLRILVRLTNGLQRGSLIYTYRNTDDYNNLRNSGSFNHDNPMRLQALMMLLVHAQPVALKLFSEAEVKVVLERVMGKDLIERNPQVLLSENVSKILTRAGGLPFHVTTIAMALKSALEAGSYKDIHDLPAGVQSAIIERFDKLSRPEQLLLKTASVLGVDFNAEDLAHVMNVLNLLSANQHPDSQLKQLLASKLIVGGQSKNFSFSDRSVQETIYNLMTEAQRGNIHEIFAEYLEEKSNGNASRLDMILHHFNHSNNIAKKIIYKRAVAQDSKLNHRHQNVYRYYYDVIQIVTGVECEKVIMECLEKRMNANQRKLSIFSVFRQRSGNKSFRGRPSIAENAMKFFLGEYETGDIALVSVFERKTWLIPEDFQSMDTIFDAKVDILSTEIKAGLISSWIAELSIAQFMMGNLIESSNLIHLCGHNLGLPLTSTKKQTHLTRLRNYLMTPPLPVIDRAYFESIFQSLQILITIYLLRGLAETAVGISKVLLRFVESMIGSRMLISSDDFVMKMINYTTCADALAANARLAKSKKYKDFKKASKLMTSAHQKEKDQFMISVYASCIFYTNTALWELAQSKFANAIDSLSIAIGIAINDGDEVNQYMGILYQAWCYFLVGDLPYAHVCLEEVVSFCTVSANRQLNIWALELSILMKSFAKDLDGINLDISMIHMLRSVQFEGFKRGANDEVEKNGLSATTNAVIAFALSMNRQHHRAQPYAIHACTRLSERLQGNAIGGVLLYCAIYALLNTLEFEYNLVIHTEFIKHPKSAVTVWDRKHLILVRTSLHAMDNICKRFTCLYPLLWSLYLRIERLTNVHPYSVSFQDIDRKLMDSSSASFQQFTFGFGFAHWERSEYCRKFAIPVQSRNYDSLQIATVCFEKLGSSPQSMKNAVSSEAQAPEVPPPKRRYSTSQVTYDPNVDPKGRAGGGANNGTSVGLANHAPRRSILLLSNLDLEEVSPERALNMSESESGSDEEDDEGTNDRLEEKDD